MLLIYSFNRITYTPEHQATVIHVFTEQLIGLLGIFGIDVHDLRRELLLSCLIIFRHKSYDGFVPVVILGFRTLDDVGHCLTRDGRDVKVSCADKVCCCLVGTFLGLGEALGIYQILFTDLFLLSVIHHLGVLDAELIPVSFHISHCF